VAAKFERQEMVSVIEAVKEMISKESYAQQPVILSLELLDCKAGSMGSPICTSGSWTINPLGFFY